MGSRSDLRIVCLVPSITELVCALGLADSLVGRTGFCVHPWDTVRRVPKVGGTKDLKLEKIRELAPTHAIVNVDENRREDAEALADLGIELVVTHPQAPRDNLPLYRQIGAAFGAEAEAERLCTEFDRAYARAAAAEPPPRDVLYLIWKDPWMTVSLDTYISQTLALFNWRTVPASKPPAFCHPEGDKRRGSGGGLEGGGEIEGDGGGGRYPEVGLADLVGKVDRVLLSSEPYHFKREHFGEVEAALPGAEVSLIDGEMTSWYGPRAIAGLDYLREYTA